MPFIIENKVIEFYNYKELAFFVEDFLIVNDIISFLDIWYNESVSEIVVKTSGSSGEAKYIKHKKTSMVSSARKTQDYFEYKARDNALLCLPVKYISGMMMLVRSIVADLNLVIANPSSHPLTHVGMRLDFAAMTPMQFHFSYQSEMNKLASVKQILLGGAPVSNRIEKEVMQCQNAIYLGYGMTETITHIALKRLNGPEQEHYFKTLPGVKLSLNEHQCLKIECDHLPSIVETTDVVNLLSEDTFEWLGRSDNIINTGGIKVSSESLESVFTKLIDANLIIFGLPSDILGQQIAIAIESDSEYNLLEKVRSMNSTLLSTLKPRTLYILDHFSYTKTDKINRNKTISRINIESGIQL